MSGLNPDSAAATVEVGTPIGSESTRGTMTVGTRTISKPK